jgi:two-component system LytT family response regulator
LIRALVVDDEELARRSLIALLEAEADMAIAGEAANGVEALERAAELSPNVIFLDIEMPGLNGFEVLSNLGTVPLVVFVTAFDEYAVRAFEANAVDYLLKPIQPRRVKQAVERLRGELATGSAVETGALKKALKELNAAVPRKIAGHKGKRIVLLTPKEIIRAEIEDKLVFLYTTEDRFLTDRTVAELEEMLEPAGFFRISRGELVNLEYVRELIPWFSGTFRIRLASGAELEVSRDRGRRLKDAMGI